MPHRTFQALRERIERIPVIDTHDHFSGWADQGKYTEPIASLIPTYTNQDLTSAGGESVMPMLRDPAVSTEKKWPVFEPLWKKTQHTAYAHVTRLVLEQEYGVREMTLPAMLGIKDRLVNYRTEPAFTERLAKSGIRCILSHVWRNHLDAGNPPIHPACRPSISTSELHSVRSQGAVEKVVSRVGRWPVNLDEYVDAVREYCTRLKARGCTFMKDLCAYGRVIRYDGDTRSKAEELFGFIMDDPRRSLGWPEGKPLDDYLFHCLMRIARDLDLPVQIHTGHMAGNRNDVTKTNAAYLRNVLELHREVRFDLFHGNWPYAGDWLFLGKNYPNVALDCCWLHIIDPGYARRALADALTAVPHCKIMGFGGDYDYLEFTCAHLVIARDNIAAALAGHVDEGWLNLDEAAQVAADWLFNNPNEFFRLGFEPVAG